MEAALAASLENLGCGLAIGAASAGSHVQQRSQAPVLVPPPAAARASAPPLLFSGPMTSAAPAAAPAAARQSSGAGAPAGYGNGLGGAGSVAAAGGGNVTKCRVCGWEGNSFQAYYHFKSQEHAARVKQARNGSPEQRICSPCGVWTPGIHFYTLLPFYGLSSVSCVDGCMTWRNFATAGCSECLNTACQLHHAAELEVICRCCRAIAPGRPQAHSQAQGQTPRCCIWANNPREQIDKHSDSVFPKLFNPSRNGQCCLLSRS